MDFEKNLIFDELAELKHSGCIHLLGTEPSCFESKNSEKSLAVRKQANQLFAKKNHNQDLHEEIWKLYTKSIAYAASESEELPAGYANRSALLLHLKKYKECLLDIDRALQITESNTLKVKLFCRQSECNVALQNGEEKASFDKAKFWLNEIDNVREKNTLREIIGKTEKIINIGAPDSVKKDKVYDLSCKNNALRINYSKKYGKHLVADRDIHIGELIYIDKFYVTTVNTAKFYAHCSHCLAISWCLIPCDYCSFYLYCSEKCKEEAWQKYHDIECSVKFGKHPKSLTDHFIQLGLRALIMGFKETGSIEKLKELIKEIDKCKDLGKRGLTEDGKFLDDSFRSIYSLTCSKSVEKVKSCIPEVLKIVVALAKNTHVFGKGFKYTNNVDLMKNEKAIFLASLFVRLSSIGLVNAFEVASANWDCEKSRNFFDCIHNFCCSRGLNISLFTSFINHSCDHNVDKFYTNDGRVVYYAVRAIEKNSQIFSSYYCRFSKLLKSTRQKLLSGLFEFHCDCVACKNDWAPVMINGSVLELLEESSRETDTLIRAIILKNMKVLKKLDAKTQRVKTAAMRTFIQDTEILLKSLERPIYVTEYFLLALSWMIELRYLVKIDIPSTCDNNANK